jgi:hypothetical protein
VARVWRGLRGRAAQTKGESKAEGACARATHSTSTRERCSASASRVARAAAGGTHTHRSERGSDVAGHVAAAGRLVVVVDALELEVGVAVVGAGRVNAVLMPCSLETTSQNLAPIWLPHWPPWIATSLTHLCCVILKRAARGRRGGEAVRQVATDDGGRGISPAPAELEQHKVAHRRACDVCTRKPQRRWSQSGILRAGEIIFNRDSGAESRKGLGRRVRWRRHLRRALKHLKQGGVSSDALALITAGTQNNAGRSERRRA